MASFLLQVDSHLFLAPSSGQNTSLNDLGYFLLKLITQKSERAKITRTLGTPTFYPLQYCLYHTYIPSFLKTQVPKPHSLYTASSLSVSSEVMKASMVQGIGCWTKNRETQVQPSSHETFWVTLCQTFSLKSNPPSQGCCCEEAVLSFLKEEQDTSTITMPHFDSV